MNLTVDQIAALAPDASSASAGKKLATAKHWKSAGHNTEAIWGECQGSTLYQVRVDLQDMTSCCSCPSRKFPCKHSLGLMLLAATSPKDVPQSAPPDWVSEWLTKREATKTKREEKTKQTDESVDEVKTANRKQASASRTAAKRTTLVAKGIDALDLWMADLVRQGLAGVELKPSSFWEDQAARMVDAQAPGIAARLRALAAIPNSGPRWPDRLLADLGRIALLTHAYRGIDTLDSALQEDIRLMVGWTLKEDEVVARGEAVADRWIVLGERTASEGRLRSSFTWLIGATTKRTALVLQFAHQGATWSETFVPGTAQEATLMYWPSAYGQRALVRERRGSVEPLTERPPASPSVEAYLGTVASALAQQPWLDRFPCVLADVVVAYAGERWLAQDSSGAALPLHPGMHWMLLALSGGRPVTLAGVWNGEYLDPIGVMAGGHYHHLPEAT
jgi:hypothetical protein